VPFKPPAPIITLSVPIEDGKNCAVIVSSLIFFAAEIEITRKPKMSQKPLKWKSFKDKKSKKPEKPGKSFPTVTA
jgi:hypothetical protein